MESLWQDLRFAVRLLVKSPAFVAIAVTSLALGIGANTAVYSVVDAALLAQLPVDRPEELVLFNWDGQGTPPGSSHNGWIQPTSDGRRTTTSMTYPQFERFRDDTDVLADVIAFAEIYRASVTHDGRAELASGVLASGGYFAGLGLQPAVGRLLDDQDDRAASAPSVVLAYGYWQRRFGADPAVVGRSIAINGQPFTVVGVTPAGFVGTLQVGSRPGFYIPVNQLASIGLPSDDLTNPRSWWLQVMGRTRPDVTREAAQAALQVVFAQSVTDEWGTTRSDGSPLEIPDLRLSAGGRGLDEVRREMSGSLLLAWGACGIVLLSACANLAGLLLARSETRRREIAVRLSIGATRGRLVRQFLTESLLLSGVGAALGLVLAVYGASAVQGLLPQSMGSEHALEPHLNLRVLAFTAVAAALTGLMFGLAPALRASGHSLVPALKGMAESARGRGRLTGRALLVTQVALSLVLLVMAGLFTRTLDNLYDIDPGFESSGVLLFRVDPRLSGYQGERLVALYDRLQDEIEALPGVRSATLSPHSLIAERGSWTSMLPPDDPDGERVRVQVYSAATNFLETMQIPLVLGRGLSDRDTADAPRVAVVNETFARTMFREGNPVGRRLGEEAEIEIVGMSRDAKNSSLRDEILPTVYMPYTQGRRVRSMTYSVRTEGDPATYTSAVRQVVRSIDPDLPLFEVKTMDAQIDETLAQERQFSKLAMLFGGVALALSCIGLYGLLSHAVVRRTREFGIRQAIGANRADLVRLIMREMRLVGVGLACGLLLAVAATRWVASMLYGLDPLDPMSLGVATAVLVAVCAVAAYIPARRASRTDPLRALRFE